MKEDLISILNKNKKAGYKTINIDLLIGIINTLYTPQEAINYTRCSLQLKDKYSEDFVYFLDKKVKEQKVGSIYWYKGIGYTDLDKLFKEYQKLTNPLIV
jgi:hypothetical protein